MSYQPHLRGIYGDGWIDMLDGNDECRAIFDRHYSRYIYADGRKPKLFVGPGERRKGPMAAYWRAACTYFKHIARCFNPRRPG